MSSKYLCDKCGRSFDTRKGLITHKLTAPHYKLAQSFIEEEQNNMSDTSQRTARRNSARRGRKRRDFYGRKKKRHSK